MRFRTLTRADNEPRAHLGARRNACVDVTRSDQARSATIFQLDVLPNFVSARTFRGRCDSETAITPAVDVWSFGVVVWELLTQETPYSGWVPHAVFLYVGRNGTLTIPDSVSLSTTFH